MAATLFNRYIWLVDTVYRTGYISRGEIDRRWARSQYNDLHEPGIPDRTFHRHKEAIREIFDIEIRCDRHRGNLYYIANTEDLEQDSMRQWLIGTFSVGTLLNESRDLRDRILFEEVPSGHQYLVPIVEAMREGRTLEIRYWSFRNAAAFDCELEPFCVKLFRQRWYLVARNVQTLRIRIYALDRIQTLKMIERHFCLPKDFDAREFFASSFGIIVDQQCSVETVRVRATVSRATTCARFPSMPRSRRLSAMIRIRSSNIACARLSTFCRNSANTPMRSRCSNLSGSESGSSPMHSPCAAYTESSLRPQSPEPRPKGVLPGARPLLRR